MAGNAARMGGAGGSAGRSGGGGGGSGGGAREQRSEFSREVETIRERTAALEAEAASLIAAAQSGEEYGDALEFARKRAELLHAAQQDGKALTPELRAEIDQLAQAYVTAGLNAEEAAERMDQIAEQGERGQQALESLFGSIIDGSMSAKEAVAQLLLEIAKMQMLNGIMGLPGMDGLASAIGGMLTPRFADGGHHTGGLRLVGERGPELEATGRARIWTAEQTRKMLNPQQQATASPLTQQGGTSTIKVELSRDLIGSHRRLERMRGAA